MNQYIEQWLNTYSAEKFLKQESMSFKKVSGELFGNDGVQLTFSTTHNYLSSFNLSNQYFLCQRAPEKHFKDSNNCVVGSVDDIPFGHNQFAVVVAPRIFMFSDDIYASLREVYRITANEGYVLLSGFNPISLMGIQSKLSPKRYPFSSVGMGEMKNYLSLLGFDIVGADLFHYSAMTQSSSYHVLADKIEKVGNRCMPMFAGGYWLVAKKKQLGLRMLSSSKSKRIKTGKMIGSVASKL